MANERRGKIFSFLMDSIVPITIILVVVLLFIPIPKTLIDFSMILNLGFAIVIMLIVVTIPRPSDFQSFPRIILIQTMFSMAINISSTRLILLGNGNMRDQSNMVQAFAQIVAGDNIVIGFVIFVIIIVVQVLVVTKGAGRVSEVAARFSLDSMNQKFFEIDNKVNSGLIDDVEAERLKAQVSKDIDFYSNMDGSSKFVSGNVKAGIFITVINLIGGFIIGMAMNGMDFQSAMRTYSILTIGDGLTSQLPSLIISFATGLLVTGTKSDETLDQQIKDEFTKDGHLYEIVGAFLAIAGVILRHGTQWLLVPIGGVLVWFGWRTARNKKIEVEKQKQQEEAAKTQAQAKSVEDDKIMMLDPLSLELGYALISLVDEEKGAELIARIKRMRTQCIYDMGFDIPKIRILDNTALGPEEYSFKIEGIEVGHATIRPGYVMCMDTGAVVQRMEGEKTKDPAFGMDAIWLPESKKSEAEAAGYVVVDATTVISTHLTEIIRSHAAQILDRESVSKIIEEVKLKQPVLVDEVLNKANITFGTIQKIFQNLLEEKVSIRNYTRILETMANYNGVCKGNVWQLTQKVRESLGIQICMQYVAPEEKKLRVMQLSQDLTEMVAQHAYYPEDGSKPYVAFGPVERRRWISAVSNSLAKISELGYYPIILCVGSVRQLVKASIEREQPGVAVISDLEVYNAGSEISVEVIDEISEVLGE